MAKAGIVYVGTSDGVSIFSDPASIGRWRRVGHELVGSEVRALVAHSALNIDVALGSAGLRHSEDGAQSWRASDDVALSLLAAHPAAPSMLFGVSGGDVLRSDDGGASWNVCPQGDRPAEPISALLVDPFNAQRVLVGLTQGGVWVSSDGGMQWDALGAGLPAGIVNIAASPNRPNTLFAVADGGVWQTGEGALWATLASPLSATSGALALLPGANEALLVASSEGIARSVDDGDSWQVAASDEPFAAPVTVIAPATYHIDTAWAGTADGRLLLSDDRGRSWRTIARDLASIHALAAVRLA